jgi:predicted nicotinamide N-methyase
VLATDWSEDALRFARRNADRNGAVLEVALLRWSDGLAREPFDLVLAADVLYERRNAEELLALLPRVVAPAGAALIADPGRVHAPAALAAASAGGWEVESLPAAELPGGAVHRLWRP